MIAVENAPDKNKSRIFDAIVEKVVWAVLGGILTEQALVSESLGFSIVCLANPMAWLFGLLTILADYILMKKKFK